MHISDFTLSFRHNAAPGSAESPGREFFPRCSRGLAPQAGAQALLAVLGAWETALVSVGPGVAFPIKEQGMLGSPRASPSPHSGPLATRGEAVPLESSSAVLPQITCSQGLRAWHGTYRASAMSTKAQAGGGPGEGARPHLQSNSRWAHQAPLPRAMAHFLGLL